MEKRVLGIALSVLLIAALPAHADIAKGKQLYEANCIACHTSMVGGDGSSLYTRANRRVNTMEQLRAQVRRCDSNLGLTWFDDQIDDVAEYLNTHYYKFSK